MAKLQKKRKYNRSAPLDRPIIIKTKYSRYYYGPYYNDESLYRAYNRLLRNHPHGTIKFIELDRI